jgi:hypothetical protein
VKTFKCIVLALVIWLSTIQLPPAVCAAGCGIKPVKPIVPIGCKDLVAQCRCDARGNNCAWEWVCSK